MFEVNDVASNNCDDVDDVEYDENDDLASDG